MVGKRALLSVADKAGIVDFARRLTELGFTILSTGGTARIISEAGVAVTPVEEVTGFAEMLDGRVKTLHPKIHGGILGRRDLKGHRREMEQAEIEPIDLVCVSFYPFEATVAREGVTRDEAVEQIDIGGPAMVRSAAKNHRDVLVVTNPDQYEEVLTALAVENVTFELRARLARAAYARTSAYDATISSWLEATDGGGDR
jgi:phosphoribosylaminoimidazolecarboxamide formyltransferase / IMP cyclohydrolase